MNRRDGKKRVLRKGEGQKNDGRYYYKYKDVKGDVHFVYSWKLEPYDIPPAGKASSLSLREMEKKLSTMFRQASLAMIARSLSWN